MSHKVNLVRVFTAATGNSTPITLGAAYSQLFMLPSEAGAMDGRTYTYLIVDGNNWEYGRGVYTASGTTLSRNVIQSRISGVLGTTRISLSGTAQVRFIESAEDMDGVRGTRAVTGTSDTLNNSDQGYVVTYSNASAVAVSLGQAATSGLFLDGWATFVKNKGAGAVTITPATSTIDGAATLVLAQNQGAMIWSDGTNYQVLRFGMAVGASAGTVAAGDDSRITGSIKVIKKRLITASGTYTPDSKLVYALVEVVGGGGGGGGAAGAVSAIYSGGGGGGGNYARSILSAATIGASQTVTIGNGGSAGAGGSNGGSGGATYFGALAIADGGLGGKYGSTSQVGLGGAAGPFTGAGDIQTAGSPGANGFYNALNANITAGSGAGGSSFFGGGGVGMNNLANGSPGRNYGGGGSGGIVSNTVSNADGGAGASGVVFITEFCSA